MILLLNIVRADLFEWDPRVKNSGAGDVRRMHISHRAIEIETHDGQRFSVSESHGLRWYKMGEGQKQRSEVEYQLRVWPGYLDAVEDAFETVMAFAHDLHSEHEARLMAFYDNLKEKLAMDRHPRLRIWREKHPVVSDVPDVLKDVRHVKNLDVNLPCHVYFLLLNGEIVYVGQTSAPWPARILAHLKEDEKKFDDVWFVEVDRQSLDAVENRYIQEFQPKYNQSGL